MDFKPIATFYERWLKRQSGGLRVWRDDDLVSKFANAARKRYEPAGRAETPL